MKITSLKNHLLLCIVLKRENIVYILQNLHILVDANQEIILYFSCLIITSRFRQLDYCSWAILLVTFTLIQSLIEIF